MFAGLGCSAYAGETNQAVFALRAEKAFLSARAEYQKATSNAAAATVAFGQAAFDWAEFATNDTQRATIAIEGISICRKLVEQEPGRADAHYYLSMNLGQLARTKALGALKIVGEMEREFVAATQLDARYDYAGPERNLGLLYYEAPGWPASVGSRTKARVHLQRALELAPEYPENHLNLIEALIHWGEKKQARELMARLQAGWEKASGNFTGEKWESSWLDWGARKLRYEKELAQGEVKRAR